jgi:hypothetical protein
MAEKGKWMRVFAKKNLFEKLVPEHSVTACPKDEGLHETNAHLQLLLIGGIGFGGRVPDKLGGLKQLSR